MKYDEVKNPSYVGTVVQIPALEDLEGLDNLKSFRAFGMQTLVSKDIPLGTVGVLFSTEVQLSEEFAQENNLHRHTNLNVDPTVKTGYLEDSRRVKAIRLRGHRSDSLLLPLTAFAYLGVKPEDFTVGDVFDSINGHEICRKYMVREPGAFKGPSARVRKVDVKNFPVHIDSENYWRNAEKVPADREVVVTQKLHGTSARFGRVLVDRDLKWYEKIARKIGLKVQTHEYKFVVGSRMVVKSIEGAAESAGKQHFYADDLWSEYAERNALAALVPEGFLVYGEIVGCTYGGSAIQKGYTYGYDHPELFIYRVATITSQGRVTDLSWEETKRFAKDIGVRYVPELAVVRHRDFSVDDWMDRSYYGEYLKSGVDFNETPVPLSPDSPCDEGVCVRWDGPNGVYILKAKAPAFLGHESAMLDAGEADTESRESA